jgi:hypothetical protein
LFHGECADLIPETGEAVPPIGRQVLGDTHGAKKRRIVLKNLLRGMTAVELGQDNCDAADDVRIGVHFEEATSITKLGYEPEIGKATFDPGGRRPEIFRKRRSFLGAIDNIHKAILSGWEEAQVVDQLVLLFLQGHWSGKAGSVKEARTAEKIRTG